jgi:hypothetical protein
MFKSSKRLFFIFILSIATISFSYYKTYATPGGVIQLPGDNRIWYEVGAYEKAKLISLNLNMQIDKIEKTHNRPFKQPIKIYVFSNQESFEKYAFVGKAGGEAHGDKILISPKKVNTDIRLPGIVLHELSHFHLNGYLGIYKARITPRWFLEGLAVWVSDGTGAEKVSRGDAIKEILVGNELKPVTRHPIFFGEKSQPSGMKPHMFYRQSAIFVEYLYELSPGSFTILLQGIEDGESFENIFEKAYGKEPNIVWNQFVNSLKHNQAFNLDLGDAAHPSDN